MNQSKVTLKFAYSKSPVPMIECRTQSGKKFLALIDTGSEITIIDKSLDKEVYYVDKGIGNVVLHSMHGEKETSQSLCILKSLTNDTEGHELNFTIKGILSDLSSISEFMKETYEFTEPILVVIGSDTLCRESAVIDCDHEQLIL